MTEHNLKTWPEPFAAVLGGRKRYEIRRDDRGYAVGDVLLLREWEPAVDERGFFNATAPHYTGRSLRVRVTYKTPGGAWGLPDGLCVMSIEPLAAVSMGEGE